MKYAVILALLVSLSLGASAQNMTQSPSESLDDGIYERPAIENLIEVWSPNTAYNTFLVNTDLSGPDSNTSGTKSISSSEGTADQQFDGEDSRDDAENGNGPQVLELLERRAEIIHNDAQLVLYPNPAVNEINVSLKNQDIQTIEIFSVSGALIYSCNAGTPASQMVKVDLNDVAKGIYMIHIQSLNQISTKKFALR